MVRVRSGTPVGCHGGEIVVHWGGVGSRNLSRARACKRKGVLNLCPLCVHYLHNVG